MAICFALLNSEVSSCFSVFGDSWGQTGRPSVQGPENSTLDDKELLG